MIFSFQATLLALQAISAKSKSCNATDEVVKAVKEIWKAGAAKQENQQKIADNDFFSQVIGRKFYREIQCTKPFEHLQMANSKTNGIGCSYNWCTGQLFSVCVYNQDGSAATNLYTNGADGETCATCPAGSTCVEGLCDVALTPEAPTSTICTNAANTDAKWITDDFRKTAVGMHNYYRRLLATGWAEDKKLGYAKWAASLPELASEMFLQFVI
ncbi:hypothetical protein Y032_1162g3714 [Ancylostoma ceylanicum]|uniref:SCP domain-containing protein n=1 Tax=Ancylostoma ceylanicum TaxID=53326 RepID=A0A016W731_9BILA|nr:hypothetical protein Y032_1162g3714 [Ancylostoma ceylanicum]